MNIRTKLFVGYLAFTATLVILGGWSAWHLREMGGVSRNIIANNYDSTVAAHDMRDSLERQNSAALFALLGRRDEALKTLTEYRNRFDTSFQSAANNITEPGESEIIESLHRNREAYYAQVDAFLAEVRTLRGPAPTVPDELREGASSASERFLRLEPLINRLREDCDNLLQINQRAMVAKSEAAAGVAQHWFLTTLGIAASLVAAGLAFAVFLANRIVGPLRELTTTAARIAAGDLDAKATVDSRDEVGILAAGFNTMAERIRKLRRSDLGKLVVAQQTTEAAIDSLYDPVIITDAQGGVTKLNPAAEEVFGAEEKNTGKHIEEIARDGRIAVAVSEALRSQRPVAGEGAASVLPLDVDGVERAFRLRTTPMRDDEGRLMGAVTLLEDITHLREIDRLKSEFIATASHELRTPLDQRPDECPPPPGGGGGGAHRQAAHRTAVLSRGLRAARKVDARPLGPVQDRGRGKRSESCACPRRRPDQCGDWCAEEARGREASRPGGRGPIGPPAGPGGPRPDRAGGHESPDATPCAIPTLEVQLRSARRGGMDTSPSP